MLTARRRRYREEKKAKLGLEGNGVLFMGGGEGVGMEEVRKTKMFSSLKFILTHSSIRSLQYIWGVKRSLEANDIKSQIVVVCGRNKLLHERLSTSTPPPPKRTIIKRILRRPKVESEPEVS